MLAVFATGACDARPLEPDPSALATLALVSVVTADDSLQWVDVRGFDQPLGALVATLAVRGNAGARVASGEEPVDGPRSCIGLNEGVVVGAWACRSFRVRVVPGDTVTVAAHTATSDTVSGTTVVPGAFMVLPPSHPDAVAPREARITWTRSASAFSYLVTLHDDKACPPPGFGACPAILVRRVLGLDTTIDVGDLDARGTMFVSVQALDSNLDVFATTGVAGGTFSTLPISSVRGGLGVVGSVVRGVPARVYIDP